MSYIRGIDVSHLDTINIPALPADIAFVSMKASQGATYQDPKFQDTFHALRDHRPEIVRFVYHFFDWFTDGGTQAKNILSRGVDYTKSGTGPLMLDLEADSGTPAEKYVAANRAACIQRVNDFIAYVRLHCGRPDLIIYSNDDFIKNVISHKWPDTIFWVASYQPKPPPFLPGWEYDFWQYSEFGKVDGTISGGHLDLDLWMGALEDLQKLANL